MANKKDIHIRIDDKTSEMVDELVEYERQKNKTNSQKEASTSSVFRNAIPVYRSSVFNGNGGKVGK